MKTDYDVFEGEVESFLQIERDLWPNAYQELRSGNSELLKQDVIVKLYKIGDDGDLLKNPVKVDISGIPKGEYFLIKNLPSMPPIGDYRGRREIREIVEREGKFSFNGFEGIFRRAIEDERDSDNPRTEHIETTEEMLDNYPSMDRFIALEQGKGLIIYEISRESEDIEGYEWSILPETLDAVYPEFEVLCRIMDNMD